MTTNIFKTSLLSAIVLVAVIAGAGYFFAPPKTVPAQLQGRIEGVVMFPSEAIPALRVCAVAVQRSTREYCTETKEQATDLRYSILVPADAYYVYATLKDASSIGSDLGRYKAYYTNAVSCGLRYECTDHTKIEVIISSEQVVTNILPHDWYIR